MTDHAATFRDIKEQITAATTTMQLLAVVDEARQRREALPVSLRLLIDAVARWRMAILDKKEFPRDSQIHESCCGHPHHGGAGEWIHRDRSRRECRGV